ncbi:AcrR family transcriptional regulator [Mycobacterium sp. MAA66]|uniref:TetR/AcrR family transcriptional regulator n=1 Tax=Mycobacterium sp. MAA66 TaxID=3156297 RepID=UPI0035119F24
MTHPKRSQDRGDKNRAAIVNALRQVLTQQAFTDVLVCDITRRASITRSSFYCYFDSKFDVLAELLNESITALDRYDAAFAPRRSDESDAIVVDRVVAAITAVLASNDPTLVTCRANQHLDSRIAHGLDELHATVVAKVEGVIEHDRVDRTWTAHDDRKALIATLTAVTAATAAGYGLFVGHERDRDLERLLRVVKGLWLRALSGSKPQCGDAH